jgi:hypothetical protein
LVVGTTESGMGATIAGLTIWPTPGVPAGTAIVADATQIVVVVREDASVAVSDQFAFNADGTVVRVIARVDVGVNDPGGLAVVKAGVGAQSSSWGTRAGEGTDAPAARRRGPKIEGKTTPSTTKTLLIGKGFRMGDTGLEPVTSALSRRRSPS